MTATAFALSPEPTDYVDPMPAQPPLRVISNPTPIWAPDPVGADPVVELARRRRFVAALVFSLLVVLGAYLAGFSLTSFGPVTDPNPAQASMPAVHVVLPGETYAGIAADMGAADPLEAAQTLRAGNGGAELVVGQRLVVAAGSFELAG